jgi:hypothetical protein
LKRLPTVALAVSPLVIAGVPEAGAMAITRLAVLMKPVEIDVIDTLPVTVPAVVGVPEIKPEEALMLRPAGSPTAL